MQVGGQEAVGEVAFDEAGRRQLLQQGGGGRRQTSQDAQVTGPLMGTGGEGRGRRGPPKHSALETFSREV